ncbi:MAG: hypothetical protein ABI980_09685 [Nitrospirota bacterium]
MTDQHWGLSQFRVSYWGCYPAIMEVKTTMKTALGTVGRRERFIGDEERPVFWSLVIALSFLIIALLVVHDWFHPAPPAQTLTNSSASQVPLFP